MDELLTLLRAIAEPTRLRLLSLCARGDYTVSELVQILGQSQPRVSRHLKVLCDAGLLERLPEGSWVFHRLTRNGMGDSLAKALFPLLPEDDETLKLDLRRLEKVKEERSKTAAEFFKANAAQWHRIRALHVREEEVEKKLLALVASNGRPVGDFLDIGTGPGQMLELFSPLAKSGVGVDMSRDMLAVARDNLEKAGLVNCTVRQGDMYQLPQNGDSFDTVLIHLVLHYADDPERAISEAARVMRPGARLALVDFAPHQVEELRTEQRHRRLGFATQDIHAWGQSSGLRPAETVELPGDPLTVMIWLLEKQDSAA